MFTLRLPFSLAENFRLERTLKAAREGRPWSESLGLLGEFALSEPERNFARELLRRKRNLWLFRCNQKRFCGDFLVVDMSPPSPDKRGVLCVELKEGRGAGGTESPGLQLRRAREATDELARNGVIAPESKRRNYIGNGRDMLHRLRYTRFHDLFLEI